MSRKNTSSVDTTDGDKIARKSREITNAIPVSFDHKKADEQIINARKGVNVNLAKAKAKKKAKMAKASKKRNKK
jgi:hypothetical protein